MAHPKVATIVPLFHLNETRDDDYFMALSHCADNPDYVRFFRDRSEEGKYVILDNSAVETGQPEDFDTYLKKAISIKASAIMLPDYFQERVKTVSTGFNCMRIVYEIWPSEDWPDIIVIPQGKSMREWVECALDFKKMVSEFKVEPVYGVSCRYTSMFGGSRGNAVLSLLPVVPRLKVHLLGCYADPRAEVEPLLKTGLCQGVDSSYPSVYAQHGYDLTPEAMALPRPDRNIDFLTDVYNTALLRKNIEAWRNACEIRQYE